MTNANILPASERELKSRIGVGRAIGNTLTFAYRALLKMLHDREVFTQFVIQPVIFTLLFAFLFGGAISGDIESYLPLIIPGVMLQTLFTSSSGAGTRLREDADKGTTSRFKSMPIARIAPLAGNLLADLIQYLVGGITVFITGFIIGYRLEAGIFAVFFSIIFMVFVAWCLSWMFAFISMRAKTISTASGLSFMVMFPLVFLSNAFVPVETMPGWLQFFVLHINPLSRVVSAARQLLSFGTVGADFWFAVSGTLAILAIFIPLTLVAYQRKA
jgi:ABC-2 type transport system permease protein